MGYVRTWDKGHQGAVWGWELHWDKKYWEDLLQRFQDRRSLGQYGSGMRCLPM